VSKIRIKGEEAITSKDHYEEGKVADKMGITIDEAG
jgi:hypothetical protein